MTDTDDFEDRLGRALHTGVDSLTPTVPTLVAGALEHGRAAQRRRRAWLTSSLAAAAVVVVAGATTYGVLHGPGEQVTSHPVTVTGPSHSPEATVSPAPGPCRQVTSQGVLPAWARTGFSDPRPRVTHVMSDHGRIVAILFGGYLFAPPSDQVNNKILWAARPLAVRHDGDADGVPNALEIEAQLDGTDRVEHREVAQGPGPSTIDLPLAGCWRLTLTWGPGADQTDTMDLQYVAPTK
ncbi:MAG: hypothetical protein U0R80_09155 [Nocardioidaceae bacterium]